MRFALQLNSPSWIFCQTFLPFLHPSRSVFFSTRPTVPRVKIIFQKLLVTNYRCNNFGSYSRGYPWKSIKETMSFQPFYFLFKSLRVSPGDTTFAIEQNYILVCFGTADFYEVSYWFYTSSSSSYPHVPPCSFKKFFSSSTLVIRQRENNINEVFSLSFPPDKVLNTIPSDKYQQKICVQLKNLKPPANPIRKLGTLPRSYIPNSITHKSII